MWTGIIGGIFLLAFRGGGWFSRVNKDGDSLSEFKASFEKRFESFEQKFEKLERKFESLEQKFESLEQKFEGKLEKFNEKFEQKFAELERKFEGRFDKVNERFDKVNERLDKVNERLDNVDSQLASMPITSRASPLSLSDLGQKVSEEISGKNWAKRQAERLGPQVLDKTEYFEMLDIARAYVRKEYEPEKEETRNWRRCAYMNGVEIEAVMEVLVMELRDVLIEQYLEDTE